MSGSSVLRPSSFVLALVLVLVLVLACNRSADRPISGAPPVRSGGGDPPPTLATPLAAPIGEPALVVALASPSPSPALAGRNPILSGLLPPPDAEVPLGPINIGGRVSASSDLVEVVLSLNGIGVQPRITIQDPRTWLISHSSSLQVGKHEARLTAKDRDGRAGGFRWSFIVQPAAQPSPAPLQTRKGPP
jgi:hypothetical protein